MIYLFIVKVEPTPDHPRYFEYQFGWLCIWITARSIAEAESRGMHLVLDLPYRALKPQDELSGIWLAKDFQCPNVFALIFAAGHLQAEMCGVGIALLATETGAKLSDVKMSCG